MADIQIDPKLPTSNPCIFRSTQSDLQLPEKSFAAMNSPDSSSPGASLLESLLALVVPAAGRAMHQWQVDHQDQHLSVRRFDAPEKGVIATFPDPGSPTRNP